MNKKKSNFNLRHIIQTLGVEKFNRFYGVYFGVVKNNTDPDNMNRLVVFIPEVFGTSLNFRTAYPRGSVAGKDFGFNYLPKVGETVVITFRFGDPKLPMWEPGYWSKGEKPEEFDSEDKMGFKTRSGSVIICDDSDESITVYNKNGHTIKIEKEQVTIGKDTTITITDDNFKIRNGSINEPLVLGDTLKGILEDILNLYRETQVDPSSHIILPDKILKAEAIKQRLGSILTSFNT